jgi:hypothetical protein
LPLGISSNAIQNNGNKSGDQFVSLGISSNSIENNGINHKINSCPWECHQIYYKTMEVNHEINYFFLGISLNAIQNNGSKSRDKFDSTEFYHMN